jgi:hypothetical protein
MKIFFFFLLIVLWSNQANAYVDPGMGSTIIQFIVAIISAITLYVGHAFGLIKNFFNKLKKLLKKKDKK